MVTNDGATILKSIYIDNPAAKVLVGVNRHTRVGRMLQGLSHVASHMHSSCAASRKQSPMTGLLPLLDLMYAQISPRSRMMRLATAPRLLQSWQVSCCEKPSS